MATRLLLLNGLATLGLVLNHASSWVFIGMFWWTHRYRDVRVPNFDQLGNGSYFVMRVVEQLVAFTVPSFLFVSGFFIAFVAGREPLLGRWNTSERRMRTLVIPYVLWSTVVLLDRLIQGTSYSPAAYVKIYLTGRAADPYYYIPLLCQCLLLAPLLIEVAKRNSRLLLISTGALQLFVQVLRYPAYLGTAPSWVVAFVHATPGWFFAGKVFWFSFGIVVGLHLERYQALFSRYKWHCVAAGAVLLPAGVAEWEAIRRLAPGAWVPYYDTALDSLYAATVIVAVTGFSQAARRPLAAGIQSLGRQSYGVFLAHSIVLLYSARAVYTVLPSLLEAPVLFFVVLSVIGLAVPLASMALMKHSGVRGAYPYVFG